MPDIELHIEELVLHGFDLADRAALAAGLQQELARLLGEQGISAAADSAIARLDAGTFQALGRAAPGRTGAQLAQQVYRAMGSAQ